MTRPHRPLTSQQIESLTRQGCTCRDWATVQIAAGGRVDGITRTHFGGHVKLGLFERQITLPGGITRPAGLCNTTLDHCTVGDNCLIHNVGAIANYRIDANVIITDVGRLTVTEASGFGNGVRVAVVNESGGREVTLFDELSAQIAYCLAFYRHRPALIERLQEMIQTYAEQHTATQGHIGSHSSITHCKVIESINVGTHARLDCVSTLENGTIRSKREAPTFIGPDVIARDFIVGTGSNISDATHLERCFVGQGCTMKQFSAQDSLFFANCEAHLGETCAVFAGPYTVTHHKSSLLIAGYYSFANIGSGTHQSNHMYRLGPNHQGITERGCKTASGAYLLWPAHIGAFSLIKGKPTNNPDTRDFPFSYVIEHEGTGMLMPGAALSNVGLHRDTGKWPQRDRRSDPEKTDQICFAWLSPYTVGKLVKGLDRLRALKSEKGNSVGGLKIASSDIEKGMDYYNWAIDKFLGDLLLERIETAGDMTLQTDESGLGEWVDVAGLLLPKQRLELLLHAIEEGKTTTLTQINRQFAESCRAYGDMQWSWAAQLLQDRLGKALGDLDPADLSEQLTRWKDATQALTELAIKDAGKEFSPRSQFGYGLDGSEEARLADFSAVRGTAATHDFLSALERHTQETLKRGDKVMSQLDRAGQML